MLTTFFKSAGLVQAQSEHPLHPRQVDLSGNIVKFSMPENFSRDFPAEDMLEKVDLDDARLVSGFGSTLILQRYWDFSSKGFFSKNIGTLQMTLVAKKIHTDPRLNIANPLDLIKLITTDLQKTYDASNSNKSEDDKVRYSNLVNDFVEFRFNNQRWIRYSIWKDNDRELTSIFAIPVTNSSYITVAFSFAPSDKVSMRDFIDEYAQAQVDKIMGTFKVKYHLANPLKQQIEDLSKQKLEDMTESSVQ